MARNLKEVRKTDVAYAKFEDHTVVVANIDIFFM
jgi:hypothetical protein